MIFLLKFTSNQTKSFTDIHSKNLHLPSQRHTLFPNKCHIKRYQMQGILKHQAFSLHKFHRLNFLFPSKYHLFFLYFFSINLLYHFFREKSTAQVLFLMELLYFSLKLLVNIFYQFLLQLLLVFASIRAILAL